MKTNAISITDIAPRYSMDTLQAILGRIQQLHPSFDNNAAQAYLLDLLNVERMEDIVQDWLVYQELEPSVSSKELHILAERVLPFYGADMKKSIFAVRQILNTIPKRVEDLVDYLAPEQEEEVIEIYEGALMLQNGCLPTIQSIDDLKAQLKGVDPYFRDMHAEMLMDHVQLRSIKHQPGITTRQSILNFAAIYYFNASVGFQCNAAWLASFLFTDSWWCGDGWVHLDGSPCHAKHFGFFDEAGAIRLLFQGLPYIKEVIELCEDQESVNHYLDALLHAQGYLVREFVRHSKFDFDLDSIEMILIENFHQLSEGQKLLFLGHQLILEESDGASVVLVQAVYGYVDSLNDDAVVAKPYEKFLEYVRQMMLDPDSFGPEDELFAPSILRGANDPQQLLRASDILLNAMKLDLPVDAKECIESFYKGGLWRSINDNVEDQFLYDAIFDVSMKASVYFKTLQNILMMAEFGHLRSMKHMHALASNQVIIDYWAERIKLVESWA